LKDASPILTRKSLVFGKTLSQKLMASENTAGESSPYSHDICLVAGTFDRMHAGHEDLFDAAFRVGRKVEIHITDDAMTEAKAKKVGQSNLHDYATRAKTVSEWCKRRYNLQGPGQAEARFSLHPLHDPFGPAVTERHYTAIACSEETKVGCELINKKRVEEYGYKPLEIICIGVKYDPKTGQKLSSTALRAAELEASSGTKTAV
jgi:phosphopantetheine adenylyltransferase